MPRPKYPLEPVLEDRKRKVDDQAAELAGAIREREAAEVKKARAEALQREAEAEQERVRAREAEALLRGELRVADLARAEAWEVSAKAEITTLEKSAHAASEHANAAHEEEALARATLAQKKADQDVVEKDKGRFVARAAQRVQAAEEEAAEEAWRPKGSR